MAENIALESTVTVNMWQSVLDAYYEVGETNFMDAVTFGMRIPDHAAWASTVDSIHDALAALDTLYHASHNDSHEAYHYEKTGEYSARVTCNTAFPSDFNYGILYGIIRKFRDETSSQIVVRREQNQAEATAVCTYQLAW